MGVINESMDNCSFDINRIDDEEECENVSEANVILKFEFLPEDVGILLDENIPASEILQDSERNINAKGFNIDFLKIFQDNVEVIKSEKVQEDLNTTTEENYATVAEKAESFVPTIIKLKEGEHRNHVIRLSGKTRQSIKQK